jgi:hypothetical protein
MSDRIISSSYYRSEWEREEGNFTFQMSSCQLEEEREDDPETYPQLQGEWFFDETALQEYLLLCCQSATGGLYDKPGK